MDHDEPCTGEPARAAMAFIGTPRGLFMCPVLAIDFYAEGAQPEQGGVVRADPPALSL